MPPRLPQLDGYGYLLLAGMLAAIVWLHPAFMVSRKLSAWELLLASSGLLTSGTALALTPNW